VRNEYCAEYPGAALWRRPRSPAAPFAESMYPLGFYFCLISTKKYVFRLMACGFHRCECTAPCGKLHKSCYVAPSLFDSISLTFPECFSPHNHPCIRPSHTPSSCPKTDASIPRHIDVPMWQDPSISPSWTNCIVITSAHSAPKCNVD